MTLLNLTPEQAKPQVLSIPDLIYCVQDFMEGRAIHDAVYTYITSTHAENVVAGWWSDLNTGEPIKRNYGELCALVFSEIGESCMAEGYDDKLKDMGGAIVEHGDAVIRMADMLGSGLFGQPEKLAHEISLRLPQELARKKDSFFEKYDYLHYMNRWTKMFEEGRRNRMAEASAHAGILFVDLLVGMHMIYNVQDACANLRRAVPHYVSRNLWRSGMAVAPPHIVIGAKATFNRNRADHKPENRRLADGKKF